jgi:hypothetical protein
MVKASVSLLEERARISELEQTLSANLRFGAAFLMDSGSSCGAITGHAKPITSVSVRHQRPFRAISGSDDNSVILHTAVPFKYEKMISTHSRFVRDVAYSPDGEVFVSVGSDGKMFVYDGKTGETKGEFDRGGATSSLVCLTVHSVSFNAECRWLVHGIRTRQKSLRQLPTASSLSVSSYPSVALTSRGCCYSEVRSVIHCRFRCSISTEWHRLRQPKHPRLRLFVRCTQRVRHARIILYEMAHSLRTYQSYHFQCPCWRRQQDFLHWFFRWGYQSLRCRRIRRGTMLRYQRHGPHSPCCGYGYGREGESVERRLGRQGRFNH